VVTNANRLRTFRAERLLVDVSVSGEDARVTVEVSEAREEELVTTTVHDPVCGMDIEPADAAGTQEFEGTMYHFCSNSCLERFKADPARYADASRLQ
jgi:Cu+-exporting ATPase